MKYITRFLLLFLAACTPKQDDTTTTFQIMTTEHTNGGIPFHVIVKSTDFPHFLIDDYQKIAHQKMLSNDDPDCLNLAYFIPGETKTIQVEAKDKKPVAIYFIFTHPGEEWKHFNNEKELHHVKILLGKNEIKSVTTF